MVARAHQTLIWHRHGTCCDVPVPARDVGDLVRADLRLVDVGHSVDGVSVPGAAVGPPSPSVELHGQAGAIAMPVLTAVIFRLLRVSARP